MTGQYRLHNLWQQDAQGNWKQFIGQQVLDFERVGQPPAEVIALLNR